MKSLAELLVPYRSVSIIGMAKNVGKTTTLNYLIGQFRKTNTHLALTSIGRDGEQLDVVTKTAKPSIYVCKGTLIATAEQLLSLCDISKEIVLLTDIHTPMGRVVLVRALSDGFVQLGGPSITAQLADLLRHIDADKIIVDGAVSRKTLASPSVTDAAILCTGASVSRSLQAVLEETQHTVRMMTLPKIEDPQILLQLQHITEETYAPEKGYIYFSGAVLDSAVYNIVVSNTNLDTVCLIAENPSSIFIKAATYEKLLIKKGRLLVKTPINLVALTVNPTSPYGIGFDPCIFLQRMQEAVSVPVYNVQQCFE